MPTTEAHEQIVVRNMADIATHFEAVYCGYITYHLGEFILHCFERELARLGFPFYS